MEPGVVTTIDITDDEENEGHMVATTIPFKVVDQYGEEIPITYSQINTLMTLTTNPQTALTGDFIVGVAAKWPINAIRKYEGTTVSAGSANPITQIGFAFEDDYDETGDFDDLYGDKPTMQEELNGAQNIIIYLKAGTQIYEYPIQTNILLN